MWYHGTTLRYYAKMNGEVNSRKKYNFFSDDLDWTIAFALQRARGRDDIGIILEVEPTGKLIYTGVNKYKTTGIGKIKKVIALVDRKGNVIWSD